MSKTGFFFYIGDYIKDTRILSAEGRGCWMDALCFLYEHGGTVCWPISAYARFWGLTNERVVEILDEFTATGVADVEWQNDSKALAKNDKMAIAKLSNRRILRDTQRQLEIKEKRAEAGRSGAAKRWQNQHGKNGSLPSPSLNPSLKEEEKEKKRKKEKLVLPDWIDPKIWDAFLEMRGRVSKGITDHAKTLIVKDLGKLRADGQDPNACLEQSIKKSWRGVFPVRDNDSEQPKSETDFLWASLKDKGRKNV